jgi:hypothetical protein
MSQMTEETRAQTTKRELEVLFVSNFEPETC